MYHSNREDPSNHRCVLYDSRSPGHFSAAAVISPSEKRQAENLTPLHHQSFHFTNDAAAQLATRSMEPCYTRPNDIVRAQQLSINLPWPAGAESAAKPHDHRNNKEHGIARICRGECTPAPTRTAPICKGLRAYANQLCCLFTRKRKRAYGFNSACHAVCSTHKDPQTLRSHPPVTD